MTPKTSLKEEKRSAHPVRFARAVTALAIVPLLMAGSSSASFAAAPGSGTVNYWLWDATQKVPYEACAVQFEKENPAIKVNVVQYGWNDYWTKLIASFVAGNPPDVFTNHLAHYGEFVSQGQMLPLDDFIKRDAVDLAAYQDGLVGMWIGPDGKHYGLPMEWDTIALLYNTDLVNAAGLTPDQMNKLSWNPTDGGTYEKAIAHMTVDAKGVRGDEAGFDKAHVAVYGLGLEPGIDMTGQTSWSTYALSNASWYYANKNAWGDKFNYGDSRFTTMMTWMRSLSDKGYSPTFELASSTSSKQDAFGAGKYAMVNEGVWNVSAYETLKGIKLGIANGPIGPGGKRGSVIGGAGESISKANKNPEASWQWLKYLATTECQNLVANYGLFFPATKQATAIAQGAFKAKGYDMTPFTNFIDEQAAYPMPIAEHAADVNAIISPAVTGFLAHQGDAQLIIDANKQIDALFN
jgi:multiple sugar transport system substrate-binding protein